MNRLQQKSWVSTYIERIKDEILKDKMNIPDGWGPNELATYVEQCFRVNRPAPPNPPGDDGGVIRKGL